MPRQFTFGATPCAVAVRTRGAGAGAVAEVFVIDQDGARRRSPPSRATTGPGPRARCALEAGAGAGAGAGAPVRAAHEGPGAARWRMVTPRRSPPQLAAAQRRTWECGRGARGRERCGVRRTRSRKGRCDEGPGATPCPAQKHALAPDAQRLVPVDQVPPRRPPQRCTPR